MPGQISATALPDAGTKGTGTASASPRTIMTPSAFGTIVHSRSSGQSGWVVWSLGRPGIRPRSHVEPQGPGANFGRVDEPVGRGGGETYRVASLELVLLAIHLDTEAAGRHHAAFITAMMG